MKIFILVSLLTISTFARDCHHLAENDNCDFYIKCLEKKFNCGEDGYPIGYGDKYCNRFVHYYNDFPEQGQEWIIKTMRCLKKALLPFLIQKATCRDILQIAFDSHPECYFKSGFCQLFTDAEIATQSIYGLLEVYQLKDFMKISSLKQVYETSKLCGKHYSENVQVAIINFLKEAHDEKFWDDSPFFLY